ncbi:MAG: N-acetyl-gamma-glutamyl-phosphate reductase [Bacillota bacterium]
MSYKIFIDGQEGTTGLKIHKRLQGRADLEIITISNEDRKNLEARLSMMNKADITFLCLPDTASKEIVCNSDKSWRILDTSTAHRTNKDWVYGFPELDRSQRDKIRESNRVAVPGCHATGFISLVKPLISLNIAEKDYPFACHSITGYSGGGKNMIAQYESEQRDFSYGSPRQYGLDQYHKHLPEMSAVTEIDYAPAFHPIVADYFSGMLVTISLQKRFLKQKLSAEEIQQKLAEYYKDQRMIQVKEFGEKPADGFMAANQLADTDGLEIFVYGHDELITLMARYDNLGKGASGAAIQCMNIMLNMPETTGLVI